ncbi:conserved hypothetical protein [Sulfolobus islandicus Y.G.57.14]|jgi:hypothetical protein|uniref:Uncharacterized protein n=6 Tax=Saccharolobus islandicus TaxID=43080 RepID=M9UA88_SACIS|nr:hypothetical protein [Sulfolobus islandicus]ACP35788.1 conserved hypothetical protein [Sulfolobus islandicus L.S.2.15]ACP46038.1 conserved hypothetical protein [Sulfolobus islandicus Y.G.57.14]ACP48252.1 conserved hypothetical protein [Sulfolobus islandicus Y.N.15.51]ADB87578.1 conserved hypothetical protein [Sulfolobus islandicus L.D.8.5]ADX85625.1 conserved hypothetical protein [Sulfolobus islandicus REY15A]
MNESDMAISRVLFDFETIINDHTEYLNELENLVTFPEPDIGKATRLVRRMRRVRKELFQGLEVIIQNIDKTSDTKIKEEALGLVNYLVIVGLKDEKELLNSLNNYLKDKGVNMEIDKDLEQIDKIMNSMSHLNF